jgi:hypothetical protein
MGDKIDPDIIKGLRDWAEVQLTIFKGYGMSEEESREALNEIMATDRFIEALNAGDVRVERG